MQERCDGGPCSGDCQSSRRGGCSGASNRFDLPSRPNQLLLPPSALVDALVLTSATAAYSQRYEEEKKRLQERAARKSERRRGDGTSTEALTGVGSVTGATASRQTKPKKPQPAKQEAKEAEVVPPKDAEIVVLERQLAANRRASVSLQRTIVQKAIVSAAAVKKSGDEEEELSSTSLGSTEEDDDKNASMATAQLAEDDLKSLRGTGTGLAGEEDSEIEIIDRYADRRNSFVGTPGSGPTQSKEVRDSTDASETKEDILDVFRSWGGTEAVEAAEAGDAAKVQRAIERHNANRIASMNLSPRSRDRDVFGKLQKLIKSTNRQSKNEKLTEARQRLAVSLQRNQECAAVGKDASGHVTAAKRVEGGKLSIEEEDDAYRNFTLANSKIREILEYKNKVQVTEQDAEVSFVDATPLQQPTVHNAADGEEEIGPEEVEQKMQLIGQLLLLLQKEQGK